jgi:tryptophan synthase alpha chain
MQSESRITQLFAREKARVAYLTVGANGIKGTLNAALALIEGGVNMLELGVPFSDPIADGAVIQRAATRSLAQGTKIQDVLWLVKAIRKRSNIPLILFSYLNPILSALASDFLSSAKQAGIDGLLVVDCPLEESQLVREECSRNALDLIYVLTSSTSLARIHEINRYTQGFLYYACRKGITGIRNSLPDDFQNKMEIIKSVIDLPVIVGFGISNQEMVKQVLKYADGAVVGSFFVKLLEEGVHPSTLTHYAQNIFPQSS